MTKAEIDALNDAVGSSAQTPAEAEVDGRRVKARPVTEQIAAAKHAEQRAFGGSPWGSVARARVVPPGTVGPRNTENS